MAPRILRLADGGPEIGGGHVMRMLTLAEALKGMGAAPVLAAPRAAAGVIAAFAPEGLETRLLPTTEPGQLPASGLTEASAVVFDHFRLSTEHHGVLAGGRPCAAVDDLADRPMGVDLIADPGPDRTPADYAALTDARLLLGPDYALVRPEFAERRLMSLALRERAKGSATSILVSMGLTDVGGITRRVVEAVGPVCGDAVLDVVVGPDVASLAWLQAQAGLKVHAPARDMAALSVTADLAIGAGGSSSFERCVLGQPAVLLILADNQLPNARALERRGAAQVIDARQTGFEASLADAVQTLVEDARLRGQMARAAAAVCDGRGADRVARAVLSLLE